MAVYLNGSASSSVEISGVIESEASINGFIEMEGSLDGSISVSTTTVPYYETSNEFGGTTVYIGKEV